jgi:hypothetical protein
MTELIAITLISRDEACQPRATTHLDLIEEYATALLDGAQFPPVTLFDDGETYWLADGYHRLDAAEAACRAEILADVRAGTRRDAILFSLGANAAHGLRRTNEDKRRAVQTMLRDEEWAGWNDGEIARQCAVTREYVNRLRPRSDTCDQVTRKFIHPKTGEQTTMNTARIGNGSGGSIPNAELWAAEQDRQQPRRNEPDRSNAYILHAMRAALEAIEEMPHPEEAAQSYPEWAEHTLDTSRVKQAARWLTQFALCWEQGEPARLERIRQTKDRIREATHVAG